MLTTEREALGAQIAALADRFGRRRSALMPILQEIQHKHHQISDFAMQEIARLLDIHPVEVYSVVTFYAFLKDKPQGRFVIRLCRTISCDMQGKDRVARQLQNELGVAFGQTTADGKFTLEYANCLGMCDQGPAMLVNERIFTRVTPEKVHGILAECRQMFGQHAMTSPKERRI